MATVVPAEAVILKRVLEAAPGISPEGLSREAYAKFDAAQMKTAWGRDNRRRFALVDGTDVLASATQHDLPGVLDKRPVRVCGIGEIFTQPAHRTGGLARELVDQLPHKASRDGAVIALLVSDMSPEHRPAGFEVVSITEAELKVTESARRGAPMTLIRGGEERDCGHSDRRWCSRGCPATMWCIGVATSSERTTLAVVASPGLRCISQRACSAGSDA